MDFREFEARMKLKTDVEETDRLDADKADGQEQERIKEFIENHK